MHNDGVILYDRPERVVHTLVKMKQMKFQPDIRTYELVFSLFGNMNAPYEEGNLFSLVDVAKRIHAIEMDMVKNGIQQNHSFLLLLLLRKIQHNHSSILRNSDHAHALSTLSSYTRVLDCLEVESQGLLFNVLSMSGSSPKSSWSRGNGEGAHPVPMCGREISFLVVTLVWEPLPMTRICILLLRPKSHMAVDIFKSMKSWGFLPDAAIYNILIDCCSIVRCFKSASALVSLMVRDGFYPQAVTYTALIKIMEADRVDLELNGLSYSMSMEAASNGRSLGGNMGVSK